MTNAEEIVYIVDDDEIVLMSVQAILEGRYAHIHGFSTAQEFLNHADLSRPGCLITDLHMPDIDGVELQRRLTATASPIAVIVVTGGVDPATAAQLLENGVMKLLEKPYSPSDLLTAVVEALAASGRRGG